MRIHHYLIGALSVLLMGSAAVAAEAPSSPLRFIPQEAEIVLQIHQPRSLIEAITTQDAFNQVQQFGPIKEYYDSTQFRRLMQMLGYFERELGAKWPELLDRLAGNGIALGAKLGDQAPALIVMQGRDEKLMQRFTQLALNVLEQELVRQESKDRPVKRMYQQIEVVQIGKEFNAAVVGSALLFSNSEKALQRGLDLHLGREQKSMTQHPGLAEAAKILPKGPLASLWINMDPVRKTPGGEELYKTPRNPALTVAFGAYVDVLGRTPFVSAGLYREKKGLFLTVRAPRGRDGMGADRAVNCPPGKEPGSRPLLEPKDVLLSYSYYMDLSKFWTERAKLFGPQEVQALEDLDKNSGRVLSNVQFSKLLQDAGGYHRIVAVNQPKSGYNKQSKTPIPAFAFVLETRNPKEFRKSMEPVLRGAALLGGAQFSLRLVEEKYKDCDIVGWRFPEDRELKDDVNDIRYSFSPCFTSVGNQFVVSSTLELGRELVDLLQAEAKSGNKGVAATSQTRFYGSGGAALLKTFEDQLIAQTVLGQAATIEEAREQAKALLELLQQIGGIRLQATFAPKQFQYDIRLMLSK